MCLNSSEFVDLGYLFSVSVLTILCLLFSCLESKYGMQTEKMKQKRVTVVNSEWCDVWVYLEIISVHLGREIFSPGLTVWYENENDEGVCVETSSANKAYLSAIKIFTNLASSIFGISARALIKYQLIANGYELEVWG